jgi:NAD(P)-dependent dehydrogenase (short-subunit alcohol dehydrogenase family)
MSQKVALIAGVGPGTGAALARAFACEGHVVALLSRHADSSKPAAEQIHAQGGTAVVITTDVTNRESVNETVAKVHADWGPITVLAYNASGYGRGSFLELDPSQISRAFDVGVMGAVHLAQAVIPDMLKAGHGFISLTGATAALRGRAEFAPLAIAKSSLRMLGQSLAREFHPKGIHVLHVIVDGQIDTPRLRARDPDRAIETMIEPDAIAAAVLNAFRQPRNAWTHEIDIRPAVEAF